MRLAPRISVAEADEVVVDGLRRILGGRFRVGCVWPSVQDALAEPGRADLAAVLIDISECNEPFVNDVRRLRAHYPGARIVLMAESLEQARVLGSMQSEVDGFILQTIRSEVVIKSLELILLGERMFPTRPSEVLPMASMRVADTFLSPGTPLMCGLSGREMEVLKLLAQGNPNKVIARDLGIAEATVKAHVKAILRKTAVRNRTEVALWARDVGLSVLSLMVL